MTCLRQQAPEKRGGILQCDEESCGYQPVPTEINSNYDPYPSPDDCVLQPRQDPAMMKRLTKKELE